MMYLDPEKWISKLVTLFERRSLTYQRFPSNITPGVDSSSTPFLQTILSVEINQGKKQINIWWRVSMTKFECE